MEAFYNEEYIPRPRCNTWPVHLESINYSEVVQKPKEDIQKIGGRKNPWGNRSYADLITEAIYSSPEHRMTLAEIYEWIIYNVPYFSQKTDSASSAGWKNSIRHNLSLHTRFIKMQNEVQGKPSWWIVNPSSPTTKTRKRTASASNNCAGMRPKAKSRIDADTVNIEQIKNYLQTQDGYYSDLSIMQQQQINKCPIETLNNEEAPITSSVHQQIANSENIYLPFNNIIVNNQYFKNDTMFDHDQLHTLNDIQEIIESDLNSNILNILRVY